MGLELTQEVKNTGATGNYLRIELVSIDHKKTMRVTMALYVAQAACSEGKQPLETITLEYINIKLDDWREQNPIQFAYNCLKTIPKYSAAKDV